MLRSGRFFSFSCCLALAAGHALSATSYAGPTVTFAAFGDYGGNSADEAAVAAMIAHWQPDFLITLGDNNYGRLTVGNPEWELNIGQYYGSYMLGRADGIYPFQTSSTQRFFPSVGNHDVGEEFGGAPPAPAPHAPGHGGPEETGNVGGRAGYLDYFHVDPGRPAGRLPPGVHSSGNSYYDFQWGPLHLFALDGEAALFEAP
ncbi:MAG: hypothetical protein WD468_03415, partial [Pirellulales bacterium]